MKTSLKLDKDRVLRFDFEAVVTLDEVCGINIHRPSTYFDFSPRKLRDLVWCAQLHTKEPLERTQVTKYLPTDSDEYQSICLVVGKAIADAIGATKESPADDKP